MTVSDSRSAADDSSGAAISERLEAEGHRRVAYEIVADEPALVASAIGRLAAEADAVITNGGTGIAPRDNTYEAVAGLLEKRMDGFGELLRMLSYEEVGSAAMASRAVAGTIGSCLIFSLPGSTAACRLATDRLIAPELGHLCALVGGRD